MHIRIMDKCQFAILEKLHPLVIADEITLSNSKDKSLKL